MMLEHQQAYFFCFTFLQWPYLSPTAAAGVCRWLFWQHFPVFSQDSQDVQRACSVLFMLTTRGGQESQRQTLLIYMWKTKQDKTPVL